MVGERILGRFTIEERLGSGGFGTVYRAWDERLHRAVAVKVVERAGDARRVAREAQAAARLAHRNIATLYELASEGDRAYLVAELVEGSTLRALARHGELTDQAVAEIGAGAAAALAHAHRAGVVHRDVKPDNVLVPSSGGGSKLVDFGIARVAGEPTLTATGGVLGTLAYMAPEQADGLRPGPAADVYSLCLTLYECWAGEHPLAAPGPAATARAIGEPVPPLAALRSDLPPELSELIDRGLDPDPEQRPLASELERTLKAQAPSLSKRALPPVVAPGELEGKPPLRLLQPPALRAAGALLTGLIAATVMAWGSAPVPLAATLAAATAALGLARPRAALPLAACGSACWLLLGAGEPGAAAVVLLLAAPLAFLPADAGPELAMPAAAPLLGVVGLGGAFPALAGLLPRATVRALIGATGFAWLAAAEAVSGRGLLLDLLPNAAPNWRDSLDAALTEVIWPLLSPKLLLGAVVWAAAAASLPFFVRGRFGVLDLLGGTLWAAALISADRLLAGPRGAPAGLLVVIVLAVCAVAALARRGRNGPPGNRLDGHPRQGRTAPEGA
jgi:hypothetical protein